MTTDHPPKKPHQGLLWTGRVLSAIPILLMLGMTGAMLLTNPQAIIDGMSQYGYPKNFAIPLICVEFAVVLLYAIPQTATLGAILLTGYFGGAIATHVRAAELNNLPIPIALAVFAWLGLLLRDPRLLPLLPFRRLK